MVTASGKGVQYIPVLEMAIFLTYRRKQMMLERQEKLDFLLEMQSKVTTNCNNSSGTEYKTWDFWWVHS